MSLTEIPRQDLIDQLIGAAGRRAPLLLSGPPGSGKTSLLLAAARSLGRQGWAPLYLDLMAAASSPDRFVATALGALPAGLGGDGLAQADELRALAGSGRSQASSAVKGLLSFWASLDVSGGRRVALFLDEATEIRSLAYFDGLRDVGRFLADSLAVRVRGTFLASSFPTLARKLWPGFSNLEVPPLRSQDLSEAANRAGVSAGTLAHASFGWPRYVQALIAALSAHRDLARAWASEMCRGGRLEVSCRHTYETLLLRSRGYGMSKAVLAAVAEEEGLNLTALVRRLGRTPGAVRDYLGWLMDVDALRMDGKRYFYVDGMVRLWVLLHGRGTPPSEGEILATARQLIGPDAEAAPGATAGAAEPPASIPDRMIEID